MAYSPKDSKKNPPGKKLTGRFEKNLKKRFLNWPRSYWPFVLTAVGCMGIFLGAAIYMHERMLDRFLKTYPLTPDYVQRDIEILSRTPVYVMTGILIVTLFFLTISIIVEGYFMRKFLKEKESENKTDQNPSNPTFPS